MKCGHLFNGIGGFAIAASWMGWSNLFHCEIDDFCNDVMNKNFPKSIRYGNIKKQNFSNWLGAIDLISGGDPCQPSSYAGSRKGKADHRYLWPEYLRCITECRPRWVVNENVAGTVSNGILDQKISDLEVNGYTSWPPIIIPASAVGALHIRDRVWLVAYANVRGLEKYELPALVNEKGEGEPPKHTSILEAEWSQRQNKSDILRMANGVRGKLDAKRIRAIGNAIVPQVALRIFQAIEFFEQIK